MLRKIILFMFCMLHYVYAARPMNTDDARITPRNQCQIETWAEFHFNGNSEVWALPGCNLFWDTEITLGGMIGLESDSIQFQVKKLFVDADKKNWGIGIALGNIHHFIVDSKSKNDLYLYVPATLTFFDSKLVFHANIGYNLQDFRSNIYSAGIGIEAGITEKIYFIGEVYYNRFDPLIYQVGLRTWIVQDSLQIDSTYGNSFDGKSSFVSLGFRILPQKKITLMHKTK
ncbi:hypothetical protein CQA53_08055 [Helicobacter didelphidarum]|uniref:Outer membrane protein beta-barrel domain-containing protein n=1 Tax=Helicobacter didelphidarum TaxID=2040648 RepID=A0A3D8IFX4_9HELI|nr:hypothetical protein [Helicobacter didelphidarum]RDU64028.1 hypothetical protein CQA53_08055 [Helicobacter didelphidarum]